MKMFANRDEVISISWMYCRIQPTSSSYPEGRPDCFIDCMLYSNAGDLHIQQGVANVKYFVYKIFHTRARTHTHTWSYENEKKIEMCFLL
jgi:hypothetical protein